MAIADETYVPHIIPRTAFVTTVSAISFSTHPDALQSILNTAVICLRRPHDQVATLQRNWPTFVPFFSKDGNTMKQTFAWMP